MSTDYPIQLYATSKKYAFPSCGEKTFVAYVYSDSKQPADIYKYGRCPNTRLIVKPSKKKCQIKTNHGSPINSIWSTQ